MPGALIQLVAYGAQDVYLTGNPQRTLWKVVYRQCTNFAIESIEQIFNGRANFGDYIQCQIGRNGDMIFSTYLVATLPEIDACWTDDISGQDANWARWVDYPGENLIDYVEIEVGGQRIDRQYGEWMHIWNQLTLTNEKREGYYKMIGHTTDLTYLTMGGAYKGGRRSCCDKYCNDVSGGVPCNTCAFKCNLPETTLFIPLQFWYCRNPGLALPLVALQYHVVKINIQLRDLDCLLWAVDALNDGSGNILLGNGECGTSLQTKRGAYDKSLVSCSLFIDYIFLDTNERRYMAQESHEYLIEQVQYNDSVSTTTEDKSVILDFNHPCKEIIFTIQQDYFRDCCKQFDACEPLYKALGIQPFNYTDCLDAMPPAFQAFHGGNQTGSAFSYGTRTFHEGLFRNPGAMSERHGTGGAQSWDETIYADGWQNNPAASRSWAPLGSDLNSLVSDAGSIVLAETALNMHCWGKNPLVRTVLQLNGQDRFSERIGSWFDVVNPHKYHTHLPDSGINVYSFALKPEDHNPSGTLNFSRIDEAVLRMALSPNMFNSHNETATIKVYATNYNIWQVKSGMGGLMFSN
jgi:hypothetical protein